MVSGLTEAYNGVGTLIRQSTPIPEFYHARSLVVLESSLAMQAKQSHVSSFLVVKVGPEQVLDCLSNSTPPFDHHQPINWANSSPRINKSNPRPNRAGPRPNRSNWATPSHGPACSNYAQPLALDPSTLPISI
ncbi:hypothetical protein LIER_20899 [Lithospermum erythrorhizon]|uniref:Uncharacterized protein n=1 Tax=Lithospermum erythrorhizon TaxID=34254 RepID=A0AAV3QN66_LITER